MDNLKIAFVTPEAVPYVKTGGLADISGVLPKLLADMGHSIRLILPLYRQIKKTFPTVIPIPVDIELQIGENSYRAEIFGLTEDRSGLEVLLIGNDFLFNREEPYRDKNTGGDYHDNDDRFIFFCNAVLQLLKKVNWAPDIIHANDWQTALIPTYLKTLYKDDPFYQKCRSVLSLHNLAYQGSFPADSFAKTGLPDKLFCPTAPIEFWGRVNVLKSGICFADYLTTVSPTYAREIQESSDFGMGLEGVLRERGNCLKGILNGVDYFEWSPKNDKYIPFKYYPANLSGKKKNKLELLKKANLPLRTDSILLSMISRLDNQKGFDLIVDIFDEIMKFDLQFILLGTGEEKYHRFFEDAEKKYPDKFKAYLKFDNFMAHLIEAGSDLFLMPSRYEPCGLNQMYSLKYGTIPLVRKTGGLADTVIDFDEKSLIGTGFVFEKYDPDELLKSIAKAVALFGRKKIWHKIVKQAMAQDFSWDKSARLYEELYFKLMK